jgi:hypothetical protein
MLPERTHDQGTASAAAAPSSAPLDQEATGQILARYLQRLPGTIEAAPRGRFNERRRMPKAWAVREDEIAPHGPIYVDSILIDVDAADGATSWIRSGVRPPNIVVANAENGHAHLTWFLAVPVRRDNERAMAYLRDVRAALTAAIPGADPAYAGQMTHSPWSQRYRTTTYRLEPYDLGEIRHATARPERRPRRYTHNRLDEMAKVSRNWFVFRAGLRYGRQQQRRRGLVDPDLERDVYNVMRAAAVEARATIANDGAYADQELRDSHRSVLRYLRQQPRNVIAHPAMLDPEARRAAARERKRKARGSVPREAYVALAESRRADIARLEAMGLGATAIAEALGCSRSEVYRLRRDTASSPVQGCPSLQESTQTRDSQETEDAGARAREATRSELQGLLLPGERVEGFGWLLDGRGDVCGLSGRLLLIRAALGRLVSVSAAAQRPAPQAAPLRSAQVIQLSERRKERCGVFVALHGSQVDRGVCIACGVPRADHVGGVQLVDDAERVQLRRPRMVRTESIAIADRALSDAPKAAGATKPASADRNTARTPAAAPGASTDAMQTDCSRAAVALQIRQLSDVPVLVSIGASRRRDRELDPPSSATRARFAAMLAAYRASSGVLGVDDRGT